MLVGLTTRAGAQVSDEPVKSTSLPADADLRAVLANPATTAVQAYELGVRFFEAKRYDLAENAWQRAYALGRDPALLVAIADTRQRRGDEPGAVAMLEQYLVERPDAPDRPSIEARIATLLQSPAVLRVRSEQPGHAILLDGVPVEQKTPTDLEVPPGSHTVIVVGEGKQVGEQVVHVGYGEVKDLDFTPETQSEVAIEQSVNDSVHAELGIEKEDTSIHRAVISTGSIAAASLAAGVVLGSLAIREDQRDQDESSQAAADKTDRLRVFAEVSIGLAALSAITSFTLFMTHKNKRRRERETAHLRIRTRGVGAAATLQF